MEVGGGEKGEEERKKRAAPARNRRPGDIASRLPRFARFYSPRLGTLKFNGTPISRALIYTVRRRTCRRDTRYLFYDEPLTLPLYSLSIEISPVAVKYPHRSR